MTDEIADLENAGPGNSAGLRLWRPRCTQKNEAPKIQLRGLGERCEIEFDVL